MLPPATLKMDCQPQIVDPVGYGARIPLSEGVVTHRFFTFENKEPGSGGVIGVTESQFPGLEFIYRGAPDNGDNALQHFSR